MIGYVAYNDGHIKDTNHSENTHTHTQKLVYDKNRLRDTVT